MSVNIELLQKIVDKVGKATFVRKSISSGADHFNMMFLIYSGIAEKVGITLNEILKMVGGQRYSDTVILMEIFRHLGMQSTYQPKN